MSSHFCTSLLCLKLRTPARASGGEELVEIEFIKLPGTGDRDQFIRHLVGEQPHLRQCAVGAALARIRLRGTLPWRAARRCRSS